MRTGGRGLRVLAFCVELGLFHDPVEGPFDFVVFGEHVSARDGAEVVVVGVDPSGERPPTADFSGGDDLADEGAELGVEYASPIVPHGGVLGGANVECLRRGACDEGAEDGGREGVRDSNA